MQNIEANAIYIYINIYINIITQKPQHNTVLCTCHLITAGFDVRAAQGKSIYQAIDYVNT